MQWCWRDFEVVYVEVQPAERPYTERLGVELRRMRDELGWSRRELSERALISQSHIYSRETGERRTRRSTWSRLVTVMTPREFTDEDHEEILEHLVQLAGPALGEENRFSDRRVRRRARRLRREATVR